MSQIQIVQKKFDEFDEYEYNDKSLKFLSEFCEETEVDIDRNIVFRRLQGLSIRQKERFFISAGKFALKIFDGYVSNIPKYTILSFIENRIDLSKEVKKILSQDMKLLEAIGNVIQNIDSLRENDIFEFDGINFTRDFNDEEGWNLLTIIIKINEDNIEELVKKENAIIKRAFAEIDIEMIKKISLVSVI